MNFTIEFSSEFYEEKIYEEKMKNPILSLHGNFRLEFPVEFTSKMLRVNFASEKNPSQINNTY